MSLKVILIAISLLVVVARAENLEVIVSNSRLPYPRRELVTGYDGEDSIYIWGGTASFTYSYDVLKFSLEMSTVDTIASEYRSQSGSGGWAGNETLLYFGGYDPNPSHFYTEVWNFKTNDPSNWALVANLSKPCFWSTSVWDGGENTYVIGGYDGIMPLNTISRYNSFSHEVVEVAKLPTNGIHSTSAVWDNSSEMMYIFGGRTKLGGLYVYLDDILKFDPVDLTLTKLDVVLPVPSVFSCAVWTGKHAYIIGGVTDWLTGLIVPPIVRFDPTTNEVTVIPVDNFPDKLSEVGCTFVEKMNRIYIFGGHALEDKVEIMYIDI